MKNNIQKRLYSSILELCVHMDINYFPKLADSIPNAMTRTLVLLIYLSLNKKVYRELAIMERFFLLCHYTNQIHCLAQSFGVRYKID